LVHQYDEPFADPASLPTLIVSEFARQYVKVVLSGEGGDEVFAGYRRYPICLTARHLQLLPKFVRAQLRMRLQFGPRKPRLQKLVETLCIADEGERYGGWLTVFTPDAQAALFDSSMRVLLQTFEPYLPYREAYGYGQDWDALNKLLYTDFKLLLPDTYLEKMDKASMAHSLEGRVPLLDHRLVEYLFTVPSRLKLNRTANKYIFRKAMEDLLPAAVLEKPKHGFAVPVDEWFRGPLRSFISEIVLDSDPRISEYLRRPALEQLLNEHLSGRKSHGLQLWTIMNFILWHRRYMSPAPSQLQEPCGPAPSTGFSEANWVGAARA
jgi:asparagine synthase (glutamine-hydrolysing)